AAARGARLPVLRETPMAAAIAGCAQYHLDALTLHGGNFPAQRRLQQPDLGLAAFDHLFPLRIRWSERITPCSSKTIPFSRIRNQRKNPRFNQLWKRYHSP